jgi:hypothetical protein
MADEPTLGEIGRGLDALRRSLEGLAGKVLTFDVWKAEREGFELRFVQIAKDITELQVDFKTAQEKAANDKKAVVESAATNRRNTIIAIFTSVVGPIATAVFLTLVLK